MPTLTAQVERCLNSRPLTPMTGDVDDLQALTPGHLLTDYGLNTLPESSTHETPDLDHLTHWNFIQTRYYLHTLRQRHKWHRSQANLQVDDLVVILDHTLLQHGKWRLERVVGTLPGPDGQVRVAAIRTQSGEYTRPIVKLARLPISTESFAQLAKGGRDVRIIESLRSLRPRGRKGGATSAFATIVRAPCARSRRSLPASVRWRARL